MVSAASQEDVFMRRADRLLRIIQILRRHRRPVRGQLMAEELEISLRTVYRDIADLVTDGVPIRGEAGVGYVLGEGYDLPPLMFSTDELEAVMLGLRWVTRRGDASLVRAARDAVAKVGTVLPAKLKPFLFDSPLLAPPSFNITKDKIDTAAVRFAIREQRKLVIAYSDEHNSATKRTIWPLAISYFDAQRLVIAWCETRNDFRSFRTDRMNALEVLSERYVGRRKVLLKDYLSRQTTSPIDEIMA
jgi:predicted DNA-binding transcriptional regulator YafY